MLIPGCIKVVRLCIRIFALWGFVDSGGFRFGLHFFLVDMFFSWILMPIYHLESQQSLPNRLRLYIFPDA